MNKQALPEINAASMADIAFQLLLFFIFATTISKEIGMIRKLPSMEKAPVIEFNDREVFLVLINKENKLFVEGDEMDIKDLRKSAKEFIENNDNKDNLPKKHTTEFKYFGKIDVTKNHVISLQTDRGTLYKTYLAVQNELTGAYYELRKELSLKQFKTDYSELEENDPRKTAIDEIYPLKVSEADPKNIAGI